ncbi:phosphoenolpyruvate carboxylase [Aureococcus anophagefferens]|nr:phosphoenolpyruvate carboxylase [Aureococcus anophagefferens]
MHPEEEAAPAKPSERARPGAAAAAVAGAPSPAAPPALRAEVGVAAAGPALRRRWAAVEIRAESAGALVACLGAVRGLGVMTHVHLRPRGGWRLSAWGAAALRVDVALARQHGASTVVVGPLDDCGFLDLPLVAELAEAARPARVAICRESFDASRTSAGLRWRRASAVYSSGGAARARDGADALRTLVAAGNEARVAVMVCRVAADDVPPLVDATGAFFFVLDDDADGGA